MQWVLGKICQAPLQPTALRLYLQGLSFHTHPQAATTGPCSHSSTSKAEVSSGTGTASTLALGDFPL